jgi:hypothetical protein
VDYAPAKLGDRELLLPAQMALDSRTGKHAGQNTVTYSGYRQFTASSGLVDDPEPKSAPVN